MQAGVAGGFGIGSALIVGQLPIQTRSQTRTSGHQARNTEHKSGSFRYGIGCLYGYSAAASFSITTFRCAVTSLCNFTGTVNSPKVFSGSCNWILRRSTLNPFFTNASARSPEVTDPNS